MAGKKAVRTDSETVSPVDKAGDSPQARILDAMRDGVILMDVTGNVTLANPAFTQITGHNTDSVVGKNARDLVEMCLDKTEAARALEHFGEVLSGKIVPVYVYRVKTASGESRWVACSVSRTGDRSGLIVVLKDITELRDAQEKLAGERHLLRILIDSLPDRIYVKDPEGRFRLCNTALAMLVGAKHPREIIGKTDFDIHPLKFAAEYRADEQEVIRSGYPLISKSEIVVDAEGVERESVATKIPLLDEFGKVVGVVGIGRDMTELKLTEARLRQSEMEHRSLVENLNIGVFHVTGDNDARFIQANPAAADIFGYASAYELMEVPWSRLFADGTVFRNLQNELHEKGEIRNREIAFVRKDGSTIWGACSARARLRADGAIDRIDGVVEDITLRHSVEQALRESNMRLSLALEELKKTQQRIIEHERLNAVGQMASGIAHDFNNALMPILGFSEFLLDNPDLLNDRKTAISMLNDIHTAAKDATSTILRLRDFYKPADTSEHALVDLNRIIDTAITLTQPKWKTESVARGALIRFETDFETCETVMGNESQLREMVINLILNACDAMPRGGTISIQTRCANGWVITSVSDTGEGMSGEVRRRCFEPFFTTKGMRGTGMGLSIVHGIVRQHRGKIDIHSEVGKGTSVVFRLPLPVKTKAQADNAIMEETPEPMPPLRILFIDDEPWSLELVERILLTHNHTVVLASTGTEGLRRFSTDSFDLVICDRAMPDMSGDQVAEKVKRLNPDMPVILLTGFGDLMKEMGEKPDGVDLVLGKPVTAVELLRSIGEVTRR